MIRVGLVGYGFMGKMHAECYAAAGIARIVSVADMAPANQDQAATKLGCAVFDSLEALLNGPEVDVIDLCSPTFLHEEQALMAIAARKHVICEKPLSLSVESCEKIASAAKAAKVELMAGHVVRFWPESIVLKEVLDSGRLGQPLWAFARRLSEAPNWNQWMKHAKLSGGPILDLHIHDLDFLSWVLGKPKRLASAGVKTPEGVWNTALTICYGHASGASSHVEGSMAMPKGYPFTSQMLVVCEKGTVEFDLSAKPSLAVHPTGGDREYPEVPVPALAHSADAGGNISSLGGYYNELSYFMSCLQEGKRPEKITPDEAVFAVRMCLAAKRAAETGEIVEL